MATSKKTVSKQTASKKPAVKKSAKDVSPPKATGKAVSAAGVRKMERDNVNHFEGMIDHAMDIGSDSSSQRLRKQADTLIEKYYYEKDSKRAGPGGNPYAFVSQKTANALSRDYNILVKASEAYEKKAKPPKPPTKRK